MDDDDNDDAMDDIKDHNDDNEALSFIKKEKMFFKNIFCPPRNVNFKVNFQFIFKSFGGKFRKMGAGKDVSFKKIFKHLNPYFYC